MADRPTRRALCAAAATGLAAPLAGCSDLIDIATGGNCGPGETEIGALDPATDELVEIMGTIEAAGASWAVDDGTGTAYLGTTVTGVREGDCATLTGVPQEPPPDSDADVGFTPTSIE